MSDWIKFQERYIAGDISNVELGMMKITNYRWKLNCECDFVMLVGWLLGNDWMLLSISNLIWSRYTENVLMLTIVDDVQSVCLNESAANDSSTENTRQLEVPYWIFPTEYIPNEMHHIGDIWKIRMRLPLVIGHVCILRRCANNWAAVWRIVIYNTFAPYCLRLLISISAKKIKKKTLRTHAAPLAFSNATNFSNALHTQKGLYPFCDTKAVLSMPTDILLMLRKSSRFSCIFIRSRWTCYIQPYNYALLNI